MRATGTKPGTLVVSELAKVEGEIDVEVTATFLQNHPNTTFFVDAAAGSELTRIKTPWVLDQVEWTKEMTIRAVVWLSQETGRGILKLTQRDYADHHLSSLVAQHGSPGQVNGYVFNQLGARIRGKSKLPRGQRIILFSPHPDDDVISMGGILRKLVENGNAITVAYMTSGNLAVFDHDVRRYVDFLERMGEEAAETERRTDQLVDSLRMMSNGLKAGLSLQQALELARSFPGLAVSEVDAKEARMVGKTAVEYSKDESKREGSVAMQRAPGGVLRVAEDVGDAVDRTVRHVGRVDLEALAEQGALARECRTTEMTGAIMAQLDEAG